MGASDNYDERKQRPVKVRLRQRNYETQKKEGLLKKELFKWDKIERKL